MGTQNIDLGNTDDVQYDSNQVDEMYLDGNLIWQRPTPGILMYSWAIPGLDALLVPGAYLPSTYAPNSITYFIHDAEKVGPSDATKCSQSSFSLGANMERFGVWEVANSHNIPIAVQTNLSALWTTQNKTVYKVLSKVKPGAQMHDCLATNVISNADVYLEDVTYTEFYPGGTMWDVEINGSPYQTLTLYYPTTGTLSGNCLFGSYNGTYTYAGNNLNWTFTVPSYPAPLSQSLGPVLISGFTAVGSTKSWSAGSNNFTMTRTA